jgi:hypothetical protein
MFCSRIFLAQFLILYSLNKILEHMKSITLLTVALSLSALAGFSQATEVQTTMGKEKGTALRIEIDEPASKVEKAMQTQLTQTGVKPTKMKKDSINTKTSNCLQP